MIKGSTRVPLSFNKDGDLLATIHSMTKHSDVITVKVSKVKGHADQFTLDDGCVRQDDLIGNDGADTAADPGRLRQQDGVINERRAQARRDWYLFTKYIVAIFRIEVNHDGYGGTAPDAMIWDEGSISKPRSSSLRVVIDHASLPG